LEHDKEYNFLKIKMLAPICLFTYNRLEETQKTVDALKKNYLASDSDIFIFSDGAKNENGKNKVEEVRQYLKTINGFKSVTIFQSENNKGLATSIISGVTQILERYGKVIVLEDDLITSANFLNFMNQALDFYEFNSSVFSISGYSFNLPSLKNNKADFYIGYRASSWGWGTWKNQWDKVSWEITDFKQFIWNPVKHLKFLRGGSDMSLMLWRQMNDKIDSWAIRWCYHQFKNNLFTVYATKSKIINIGVGNNATHTKRNSRFEVELDDGKQEIFKFEQNVSIDRELAKEFRQNFSVVSRLKDKFY
jgi:hypothetical protein